MAKDLRSNMNVPLLFAEIDLAVHTLCYLQCAGNRRTAMSKTRKVKGVGWDIGAIGNGSYTFSLLHIIEKCDVYM